MALLGPLIFLSGSSGADDSTWRKQTLDLSSYQSSQLKIRFNAISTSFSEHVNVDDVSVNVIVGGSNTSDGDETFAEEFDDITSWTKSGDDRWRITSTWREDTPPDGGNFLAANNCDNTCTLTLAKSIDLSSQSSANLEISRFVDRSLDSAENLGIDVYDGSKWVNIATWSENNNQNTDEWETETINISTYLGADFKIKINAQMSSSGEDVGINYIRITG